MKLTIKPLNRDSMEIEVNELGTDNKEAILVRFGVKMFCSTPDELKKLGFAFIELSKNCK